MLINEGGKLIDKTADLAPEIMKLGRIRDAKWAKLAANSKPFY